MRRYVRILQVPRLGRLLAASLPARLPMGINGLALVLLLRAETGSFGLAGAAAGALALGTGLGAPVGGRLIDRLGPRVMLVQAVVHAAGLLALIALAQAGAPAVPVVAAAVACGVAFPTTSSVLRVQYPRLLRSQPDLLQGAFALDSVLTESIFTVGPLLTAALVITLGPAAALAFAAVAVLAGTAALMAALPATDPGPRGPGAGALGALAAPGIRTLIGAMVPVGFSFGAVEVALPAFAQSHGRPGMAGVLVALWSIGSIAGGLAYGARPRRASLVSVHVRMATALPIGFLPLALADSPLAMAALAPFAGLAIAPLIATRNELAGAIAPEGARTEAYTWPLTALVAGIALGSAAAGAITDASSWQAAVLLGAAAAAVSAVVSASRRRTLVAAGPAPHPALAG
jgi:MFS family permease